MLDVGRLKQSGRDGTASIIWTCPIMGVAGTCPRRTSDGSGQRTRLSPPKGTAILTTPLCLPSARRAARLPAPIARGTFFLQSDRDHRDRTTARWITWKAEARQFRL